jgi:hypothetical protein
VIGRRKFVALLGGAMAWPVVVRFVFLNGSDLVKSGLVVGINRPGGRLARDPHEG